jgi:hypothetical protein
MATLSHNSHTESKSTTTRAVDDDAIDRVSCRLETLFEQAKLAADARDPELLESILRELSILNDIKIYLAEPGNHPEPFRAIIESLDPAMNQIALFPMAGSLEADNRVCREIERRWTSQIAEKS